MKADKHHQRTLKLRNAAIDRLVVAKQQIQALMGDAYLYDWLASEMQRIEERIQRAHKVFGVPHEEERPSEVLAEELADANETLDRYGATLSQIRQLGGPAGEIASKALGRSSPEANPHDGMRVSDTMDRLAVVNGEDDEMQAPRMQ